MAWAAVAVGVGSAAVNVVGGIQAGKKASAAERTQAALTAQEVSFAKEQFQRWQDVYGPIQDNLSNFFQNLSGDSLIASGLKHYEAQFQDTQHQIQRSFAQRNIDSGAQDFLNQEAALTSAEFKATLRNNAPLQVAQAQGTFLRNNVTNPNTANVLNAYAGGAQFQGQQARQFQQQQVAAFQEAGQALNGAITAGVGGFNTPTPTPTPTPTVGSGVPTNFAQNAGVGQDLPSSNFNIHL